MELAKEHVAKTTCGSVTFVAADGGEGGGVQGAPGFRVALAGELALDEQQLPAVCTPSLVRIKQRRCFRDVREGLVVWSYELSRSWAAPTQREAEQLHHDAHPTYEGGELTDAGGPTCTPPPTRRSPLL